MSVRLSGEAFGGGGGGGGEATSLANNCTGQSLHLSGNLTVDGLTTLAKLSGDPYAQDIGAAGATIPAAALVIDLTNTTGSAITLTSTPSIETGGVADGQVVILQNVSAAGSIILQDEAVLAGTKLRLVGATNKTLGTRDLIGFRFNAAAGEWHQLLPLQTV